MDPRWRALLVLTVARTTMGFQFQSLPSVSPDLMRAFSLGYGDLGLLIGLYFLPGVFVALPAAAAGARFGDKRMVLAGLLLMFAGGLLTAFAPNTGVLAVGRASSGAGAVLLNVLMSKMVTDWFAGRELALAMSIFVNSFPIGIGLALLTLGGVASIAGWQVSLAMAALLPVAACALLWIGYTPHDNDRAGAGQSKTALRFGPGELVLVCIAGAMWGIFNGGFAVMTGFTPLHLANAGLAPVVAATIVGLATWALVASVQVGGILAQKWNRPGTLIAAGCVGWAVCLLASVLWQGAAGAGIVAAGLLMGLPAGVILSLPGQALHPSRRAMGMGVFYLWLYLGHGTMPPLAGWLQDRFGSTSTSLVFTAVLALAILGLYALFRGRLAAQKLHAAAPPA